MIDLKEILAKKLYPGIALDVAMGYIEKDLMTGKEIYSAGGIMSIAKELWNTAVDTCAETFTLKTYYDPVAEHPYQTIEEESIEQVKKMIL